MKRGGKDESLVPYRKDDLEAAASSRRGRVEADRGQKREEEAIDMWKERLIRIRIVDSLV